jgi:hypothetical protein
MQPTGAGIPYTGMADYPPTGTARDRWRGGTRSCRASPQSPRTNGDPTMSERVSGCARSDRTAIMPLIRLGPVVLAVFIAGCGAPAAVPQSKTETPSTTSFDGSYQSTIRVTSESATVKGFSWCQTPGLPIITVTNGQFIYGVPHPDLPGNHQTTTFPATIEPDGSFVGQGIQGTIWGQVRGAHIEGRIDGVGCLYAFTGNRV